ncbi:type IV restriction endonuclease Mrr [Streptomyces sp. NBRC 110611]|uniref:restriction endonuclease subunit S n=1 Tax=Streptomyces sp. NBRC 110611 TaxID=1621259 RepID=UPI000829E1BB|nr:restriction endonuclease subunit S [Streptomyces sp. NBRC 110611]GAU67871.1 type IV restriction endonuclease Mrr [Streptomyces sp. NBRC 110611]
MSEKELPEGWTQTRLGAVCEPVDKVGREGIQTERFRYIDISSVDSETKQIRAKWVDAVSAPGRARQVVRTGDTVYSTVRPYLRKIAHVSPTLDKQIASTGFAVIRPNLHVESRYLFYAVQHRDFEKQVLPKQRGVSYPAVRDADVFEALLPLPPAAEQRRIVEALEEHLSHLDAAAGTLAMNRRRVISLQKSLLLSLIPEQVPESWELTTVGSAGTIDLGRQRHPDWHHGPEIRPYLRVANVFEDRIDTSDVMEMDFSGVFDRYKLRPGDVLLNEGQSPHLVGRPALYRGVPENVAFTNSLLRFRARPGVLPEWALLVFRRHLHARRFMQEVRITTNIAHLSAKRLKAVEFPIPPMAEQKKLVQLCEERMASLDTLDRELEKAELRSRHLRQALLSHAFAGRLVPQDPDDEPASELLARIQAERATRAAQAKPKRARRAVPRARSSAGPATAAEAPPPEPSATPLPRAAVQQTFEVFDQ